MFVLKIFSVQNVTFYKNIIVNIVSMNILSLQFFRTKILLIWFTNVSYSLYKEDKHDTADNVIV